MNEGHIPIAAGAYYEHGQWYVKFEGASWLLDALSVGSLVRANSVYFADRGTVSVLFRAEPRGQEARKEEG